MLYRLPLVDRIWGIWGSYHSIPKARGLWQQNIMFFLALADEADAADVFHLPRHWLVPPGEANSIPSSILWSSESVVTVVAAWCRVSVGNAKGAWP